MYEHPPELADILPVGFGDEKVIDDEMTEEGEGMRWNDHGLRWVRKQRKDDRFVFTLTRMVSNLPEGKPL